MMTVGTSDVTTDQEGFCGRLALRPGAVAPVIGVDALHLNGVLAVEGYGIDRFDVKENRAERIAAKHVAFDIFEHDVGKVRTGALWIGGAQPDRALHCSDREFQK